MYQLLSGKVWDFKWSAVGKKSIIFSSKEKKQMYLLKYLSLLFERVIKYT